MTSQSSATPLVESVAQALVFAINDPVGHSSWTQCYQTNSCKRRRAAQETQRAATVFDSSAIPPIGIDKYLKRLSSTFRCSESCFIAALIVVDRLLEYDGGRLPLTMRNVHRIYLASLVVTVKYTEDLVYSNNHYAKCGGVHLREVNRLERVLLMALGFDIRVEPEQFQLYEAALRKLGGPTKGLAIGAAGSASTAAPSPSAAAADSKTAVPPPLDATHRPVGNPEGQPEGRPEGYQSVGGTPADDHGVGGGNSSDRASVEHLHGPGAPSSRVDTAPTGRPPGGIPGA
mmetsp:Transcript_70964/g.129904  ORF Transcript_70964/g.129904 Transcript_70964/m.129904 type:complete len:288 (-) Transcript_70964:332-1195(-)